ncbi:hypothetical protein GYMLUDRAFT_247641 [Collybiopsis luxurians FD-317 M1]|uniref:Uncharacterized protein n=1 Tax=Collybiopsis luxurians FD-317 M1 TaxID=944289 RepID=A0A0D0C2S2_9AGAR|nr:hypothetical protein GYMLUDRAFT_247641 [Collybiopsis luxurians FD-317 M1]
MEQLCLTFQQQTEQEEEEQQLLDLIILAAVAFGILNNEDECIRRMNPSRLYLTRPQLMPHPRLESPWICLWQGQDDRAFITTMGLDVATFHFILEGHGCFADVWDNAAGALGLVLHYLGSAIHEVQLQQIFAIVPSVLTRYLHFSLDILLATLRKMKEARIALPETQDEYEELSLLVVARHPLLEGAFGSIDGLALPAQVSDDPEIENATYNGWKTDHTITNVLMFSPKG